MSGGAKVDSVLAEFARDEYARVAYDLPKYGRGHHSAAHDHVADRMCEQFGESHAGTNWRSVTRAALRERVCDDRKETRAYEARLARREAAALRPPRVKKPKPPPSPYGRNGITRGARRGIGSY